MDLKTTYNSKNKLAVFQELQKKENNLKRKSPKEELSSIDSQSDCELVIDDDYRGSAKKKVKTVKFTEEPLNLQCMWGDCSLLFVNFFKYAKHVEDHVADGEVKCSWSGCDYVGSDTDILIRHLCYHSYYVKLQHIGKNVVERYNLSSCNQSAINFMPESYNEHKCEWGDCKVVLRTYTDFLFHVMVHLLPANFEGEEFITCSWHCCNYRCKFLYKLQQHIRTHTREKVVACPTCWTAFASNTKLADHRRRQLPTQLLSFQCSQCSKLFACERLLRDHMKSHINHYKCNMCEMTCSKPSALLKHIRYRHLNDRPFKCHLCAKRSVTKSDLQQHLTTHSEEKLLACDECDYRCRTIGALDTHYRKIHNPDWGNSYECHCCQMKFRKGCDLTRHLMGKHDYYWPAGHSRFRYREGVDGIYRLQTVRYESLEVTQEMMSKKPPPEFPEDVKIKIEYEGITNGRYAYKLSFKEADDDNDDEIEAEDDVQKTFSVVTDDGNEKVVFDTGKQIEIVFEDVDELGNVVKTETITSNEIVCKK